MFLLLPDRTQPCPCMNFEVLKACFTLITCSQNTLAYLLYFTKWIYLAKSWPWDLNRMSLVSANWFFFFNIWRWTGLNILQGRYFLDHFFHVSSAPSFVRFWNRFDVGFWDPLFWAWQFLSLTTPWCRSLKMWYSTRKQESRWNWGSFFF